ncbi:MAG: hypothetical protein ACK5N8_06440 [Alphaproteobacteria bacterium]
MAAAQFTAERITEYAVSKQPRKSPHIISMDPRMASSRTTSVRG